MNIPPTVVDEIYEAAFIPERWPGVLDTVAGVAGCQGTTMFLAGKAGSHFVVTESIKQTYEDCVRAE